MAPLYRNRETGIVQRHPKSGIGDSLNSDEIDEGGKPFVSLPITPDKVKRARNLKGKPATSTGKTEPKEGNQ